MLKVKAGDKVAKDQLLGVIDSPDLRAKLAQEQSNADALRTEALRAEVDGREQRAALRSTYENAAIDLQTARNDLDRQTKAYEAGAVAGMQVEKARDAMEKARITAAHAQAGLGLKDHSLKFELCSPSSRRCSVSNCWSRTWNARSRSSSLHSPVDGQVGQLLVAERANVAAGTGLLSVVDLSALEVQMQVPESFARDLAIGMPGEISGNGRQWKGLVSTVSPEVVNNEVAARLRFDGATPDQLRQNQRLSVRVLLDRRDKVLTVARGSFVEDGGGRFVYVVQDGQAVKRPIRLGAQSLSKVEILEGLKPRRAGHRLRHPGLRGRRARRRSARDSRGIAAPIPRPLFNDFHPSPPARNLMLKMQSLSKVYRTEMIETYALREFNLDVREGEFVAVTGPSGSGKTTFLTIAGLLEAFTGGRYQLDGVDVSGMDDTQRSRMRNEKIGFIFQAFNLIPDLNVLDNIEVPLRYRGMKAAERQQRARDALARVGLSARERHYPAEPVRRPAAARGHRPRAGRLAAPAARRRADRQPRQRDGAQRDGPARGTAS